VSLVTITQGKAEFELLPLRPLRDVRVIEGYLDELLQAELDEQARQDYLMVRLLDKSAILDAMGKLREVYPNVLHLERTGLMANKQQLELNRQHMSRDEFDMFSDFFSQVSGEDLSDEQREVLLQTISQLHERVY
jgi:exonuclease SbcD